MFCEKCGTENPDNARFCAGCGHKFENKVVKTNDGKNMILALVISFILTGLGIAYAGNVKKGALLFVVGIVFSILGLAIPICAVIGMLIWAYALYQTYNEVQIANGRENPNLIDDWKGWDNPKKTIGAVVAIIVILIVIGGAVNAFSPHENAGSDYSSTKNADRSSLSSSPSSSGSGGSSSGASSSSSGSGGSSSSSSGDSYSHSSNGHDVSSHYEGEHGSSDTHGTVYDDGSVESHQTGHTDYGDYQVDSYMDSNGNIHGTVDVGGKTYHVDT